MRSHFAAIASRMTIKSQRLDPPWRAYTTVFKPAPGGTRGIGFRQSRRGRAGAALLIAAFLIAPSLARAAGPPPQAQPPASPPAPEAPAPRDDPPAAAQATPAPAPNGMVRYDKPVLRNGHLVLWHGAWRDGAAGGKAASAKADLAAGAAGRARPHEFLIVADSADASATRMASQFAAAMQSGGLRVRAAPGRTSAAALDKAVNADAADLAIVSMDGLIDAGKAAADKDSSDWRGRTPYLLRLSNEPIELIAARGITDISQLAGRKVNVGPPDSAAAASAAIVFSRLNIAVATTHEDTPAALADLANGQFDAIFVVGGDDFSALADLDKAGRFHVVAIPYPAALQGLYSPMRLTSREQPNLIGEEEKVDTIGVTTALLAIDAPANSPRAERIAPLTDRLFSGFEQLRAASDDSNWKEVNLTARIIGWPRLDAAQSWLDQNQAAPDAAFDAFRNMAQTAAGDGKGPSAADFDRLYESLLQWSGAAQ